MSSSSPTGPWQEIEAALTLQQKFRLVEIAHESTDLAVKRVAIEMLMKVLRLPIQAQQLKAQADLQQAYNEMTPR